MPVLIVEHRGARHVGGLRAPLYIGRRRANHVVLDGAGVARLHAWIGADGRQFFVADAGSQTGTFVNGEPLGGPRALREGDRIRIGDATLTFASGAAVPADVPRREFVPPAEDPGIFFHCTCGIPIWAARALAGRSAWCARCDRPLVIPAAVRDKPAPPAPVREARPEEPRGSFPWEYLLLALSVLAAVASALSFGVPSLLTALLAVFYLIRPHADKRRAVLGMAIAVSLVAAVAGAVASSFWWLSMSAWERWF